MLHGARSFVLCDDEGQIAEAHSISAGLDYPGVGPEHSYLKETGRARYLSVTDEEALGGFQLLARTEGILPALESSHAIAALPKIAAVLPEQGGDGGQPVGARRQGHGHDRRAAGGEAVKRIAACFARARAERRKVLVVYLAAQDPDFETSRRSIQAAIDAGADIIEIGVPWSDPSADGPVIQAAMLRALEAGGGMRRALELCRELAHGQRRRAADSVRLREPDRGDGSRGLRASRRATRAPTRVLCVDYPPDEDTDLTSALARQRARFHSASGADLDAAAHGGGRRGGRRVHLLRLDDRHHRRPARRTSTDPRRRWRRSARPPAAGCRSWSASASRRPPTRAPSPRFADGVVVGSAAVGIVRSALAAGAIRSPSSARSCARCAPPSRTSSAGQDRRVCGSKFGGGAGFGYRALPSPRRPPCRRDASRNPHHLGSGRHLGDGAGAGSQARSRPRAAPAAAGAAKASGRSGRRRCSPRPAQTARRARPDQVARGQLALRRKGARGSDGSRAPLQVDDEGQTRPGRLLVRRRVRAEEVQGQPDGDQGAELPGLRRRSPRSSCSAGVDSVGGRSS